MGTMGQELGRLVLSHHAEHELDRHNAGFWFVDSAARAHGATLAREGKFHGDVGRARIGGEPVFLLEPATYMNRSGQAVAALAHFYRIAPEEIQYLMARGMSEEEATATIVRGFLNVNIEGLPATLSKKITDTLDAFQMNKGM